MLFFPPFFIKDGQVKINDSLPKVDEYQKICLKFRENDFLFQYLGC